MLVLCVYIGTVTSMHQLHIDNGNPYEIMGGCSLGRERVHRALTRVRSKDEPVGTPMAIPPCLFYFACALSAVASRMHNLLVGSYAHLLQAVVNLGALHLRSNGFLLIEITAQVLYLDAAQLNGTVIFSSQRLGRTLPGLPQKCRKNRQEVPIR